MSLVGQVGVVTKNPGWYGKWVQRLTGSPAFHTITAVSETECVSAETPKVVLRPISDFDGVEWTNVQFPSPAHQRDSVRFVLRQVGKGYAYFDILLLWISIRIGREHTPWYIKNRLTDDRQWFCSELGDAGLEAGRVNLFPTFPPSAVIPKDFLDVVEREQAEPDELEEAA